MRIRGFLAAVAFMAPIGCVRTATSLPGPESVAPVDASFFDEHPLMIPVEGVSPRELKDSFGDARANGRTHQAIDILAPRGTAVVAAMGGEVLRLRQNAAGGITAYLVDEQRRYVFYYAHLAQYSDRVTEGLRVPQGFVIGYVGTSGNAPPDTPHLHFQVMRLSDGQRDWWNGKPVDVRAFMTRRARVLE